MNFTIKNLIGSHLTGTFNYSGSDTKESYLINLKRKKNTNWVYENLDIIYNYNDAGHRCKSVKDLDTENYILFCGCSNTEGIGVRLEDSFPYLVSKELNLDYYNLGVGSTGLDVLEYNLFTWLKNVNNNPKLIVIQWPDHSRFIGLRPNYDTFLPYGNWSSDKYIKNFISASEITYHNNARKFITENLIRQSISNLNVIRVQYQGLQQYDYNSIYWRYEDKGRDLVHPGIKSHAALAKIILQALN
jgi:hypothetical protein